MRVWLGLLGATLLGLGACTKGEPDPKQFPISRAELAQSAAASDPAELTFRRYCVGCHGMDGHGNEGSTGADLAAEDSPLRTRTNDQLIASVRDGKVGKLASMPAHKPILSDSQIAAVVGYVRAKFGPDAGPQ
jgi:mono/diheme cytochrome c family protein